MDGKEVVGGPGDYMHINTRSHGAMYHDSQLHAQAQNGLEMEEYKKEKNSHIHDRNHEMQKTTAKGKRAKALSTKDQEDINLCAQLLNEAINQMNKSRTSLTPVASDYDHNKSKMEPTDNKASKKGQNKSKKEATQRNAMNNPTRGSNMGENRNSRDTRRATSQKHMIENQNNWAIMPQTVDMMHPIPVGYFGYPEDYASNPAYMHEFQHHHLYFHPQPSYHPRQPVGLFNCPRSARHVGIANYIWRHIGNQEKDPTEFARMIKKRLYDNEGQEYEQMQMFEQQQPNAADYQTQNATYQHLMQIDSMRYHQSYYPHGMHHHMMDESYFSQYTQMMHHHMRAGELHQEQMGMEHEHLAPVEEPQIPQPAEQLDPPKASPEVNQMLVEGEELDQLAKPPTN